MLWPDWLDVLVLVLGTYRLVRLGGWDDFPPVYRARAWLIGEHWVPDIPNLIAEGERVPLVPSIEADVVKIPAEDNFAIYGGEVTLPGKQPSSEAEGVRPAYTRPLLAHLIHCPWCLSWWVSLATLAWWLGIAWVAGRGWADAVLAPFALSSAVGLIARNLDP